jgi:hypothetical protein
MQIGTRPQYFCDNDETIVVLAQQRQKTKLTKHMKTNFTLEDIGQSNPTLQVLTRQVVLLEASNG